MNYLNADRAYPVIQDPNKTNGFLANAFTRAVIIDNDKFSFNPELITDIPGAIDPKTYWDDANADKNRKEPGMITYVSYLHAKKFDLPAEGIDILTKDSIKTELKDAGMHASDTSAARLLNIFHDAINTFSDIVAERAQTDRFYMRCWQTFAPAGAQGRAPNIHIDKTDLTGLWYAGRAPAQIYTGDIQEDIWTALADNTNDSAKILTEFTQKIEPKDLLDMPTGTLNIVLNKKGKDLKDQLVRNKVCPHMSSNKIPELGQAGLILVPKFLD